ncbi:MAG: aldehyde ferredoxin oxidoreductase C-terminal domain-containing protein, partial [Thermodesulfobacteriota bacterium]|nr:aldehyde ferredoxin oxidoreductase C-terminal domain-containing protein [Thermodesulfobacteriota bacterium]
MYGWQDTYLDIDLTKGEIIKKKVPEELVKEWIGGETLGTHWLYNEVPPGTDCFDPKMLFMLLPGPGSGTLFPGSGRMEVVTKSAISPIFGDSNVGGDFGPEVHNAGYEAIKIKGKAEKPVYLFIDDDKVELRDATHLWGLPHLEAIEKMKDDVKIPDAKHFMIGPAGEKMVRFACCYSGNRSVATFNGAGAVMGSKNLKGIIVRGTKGVKVYDPVEFEKVCFDTMDRIMSGPFYWVYSELGAVGVISAAYQRVGVYDGKNLSDRWTSEDNWRKTGYLGLRKHKKKNAACYGCFVHCKHIIDIKDGPYKGTKIRGTEFYPSVTLGSNLGIYNSPFFITAVKECDVWGIDVGNTGGMMGFAAELFENGVITEKDTDGLRLNWGNEEAFMELIGKIGRREGFGDVLADGMVPAVEKIGKKAERFAMQAKGFPMVAGSMGYLTAASLAWVTATNGNFVKGQSTMEWGEGMVPGLAEKRGKEFFGIPTLAPESFEGKEKVVVWAEDSRVIGDTMPCCAFMGKVFGQGLKRGIGMEDYAAALTALTGVKYDADQLYALGKKVYIYQMVYNAREGLRRKDFTLPDRLYEPIHGGPRDGFVFPKDKYEVLLDHYFEARGFDPKTVLPTRKGLQAVGLDFLLP